jgi:hypothetical protein
VSLSAVKPNEQSGNAAISIAAKVRDRSTRSLRRGRPAARTQEVRLRVELFRLRAGKLSGELLDRKTMIAELTGMFGAIREIILASKLTDRQKQDLLHTLAEIPIVVKPVSPDENHVP